MKKLIVLLLLTLSGVANAGLIAYDWTWTGGSSGNNAIGTMSYSDSLANTGVITASSISGFSIQGYTGTNLRFAWDLATGTQSNPFQLSFDTTSGALVFGGFYPTALDSVVWGDDSQAALVCGNGSCGFLGSGLTFDGISVSDKSQFVFSLAAPTSVPEPTSILLLGAGLACIGLARKKKKV